MNAKYTIFAIMALLAGCSAYDVSNPAGINTGYYSPAYPVVVEECPQPTQMAIDPYGHSAISIGNMVFMSP